jgi:hypothetical protein
MYVPTRHEQQEGQSATVKTYFIVALSKLNVNLQYFISIFTYTSYQNIEN